MISCSESQMLQRWKERIRASSVEIDGASYGRTDGEWFIQVCWVLRTVASEQHGFHEWKVGIDQNRQMTVVVLHCNT